jgi:anti-sigma28 factor (negative regulator of flagellin synthesis)
MRIQDRNLAGTAAASGTEVQQVGRDQGGLGAQRGKLSEDRLSLSALVGKVSEHLESASAARAKRVEALAGQYKTGDLKIDSAQVSKSILKDALSSHAA